MSFALIFPEAAKRLAATRYNYHRRTRVLYTLTKITSVVTPEQLVSKSHLNDRGGTLEMTGSFSRRNLKVPYQQIFHTNLFFLGDLPN